MAAKTTTQTPAVNTDPIAAAKEAVTVTGTERARALRTAAETAAITAYGPFTIVEAVELAATEPKFAAWISGARGRSGFLIALKDGRKAVVGKTTLASFLLIDPKSVTNAEAYKVALGTGSAAPTMKGIIG